MVHFGGRLLFRLYIPLKSHKYSIKIYKLRSVDGYVWSYEIYCGQSIQSDGLDTSGSIITRLVADLLDTERLIVTDKYYTSIQRDKEPST